MLKCWLGTVFVCRDLANRKYMNKSRQTGRKEGVGCCWSSVFSMKNAREYCWEIGLMHTFVWEFNLKVDQGAFTSGLLVLNQIWLVLGVPEKWNLIGWWFAATKLPLEMHSVTFIISAVACHVFCAELSTRKTFRECLSHPLYWISII